MNVLLTAVGSMSSESVIKALRDIEGLTITGTDIYPDSWIPASKLVDYFYQAPKATDDKYFPFIMDVCRNRSIDFIIPLTDPEVDVLSFDSEKILQAGYKLCTSNQQTVSLSRNKKDVFNIFKNSNVIRVIPTYSPDEIHEDLFHDKMIAKIVNGRSSEGLKLVKSWNEFQATDWTNYIFQPVLEGHIFTVDYIRDAFSNQVYIPRKELLRTSNGAGLTVEVQEEESLGEMVKEVGHELNILGAVNIEFIKAGGAYYLMDINPRFSAGLAFSMMAGYNFVANHMRCFMNERIDPQIIIKKQIFAKQYTDIRM